MSPLPSTSATDFLKRLVAEPALRAKLETLRGNPEAISAWIAEEGFSCSKEEIRAAIEEAARQNREGLSEQELAGIAGGSASSMVGSSPLRPPEGFADFLDSIWNFFG